MSDFWCGNCGAPLTRETEDAHRCAATVTTSPTERCTCDPGPEGQHQLDRCDGNWSDIHNRVHPGCSVVGLPHPPHTVPTSPTEAGEEETS